MKYRAYICKKCGRAQGTSSKVKGICVVCRTSNNFNKEVKIIHSSDSLREITNAVKTFNANSNGVIYQSQKE